MSVENSGGEQGGCLHYSIVDMYIRRKGREGRGKGEKEEERGRGEERDGKGRGKGREEGGEREVEGREEIWEREEREGGEGKSHTSLDLLSRAA